ncbi:MAG: TRAP transporter small permease [Rhodobacteraceae bacterium]|nr:TRAP transporter small permease [Paracoccaceae bacterium]MCY4140167.1 TRAP transporter small permease [Paracoccaceae bacterium]
MADVVKTVKGARDLAGHLLQGVAHLGGLVLFVIMLLVSTTVFYRYVLNQPILGDQELVEIGMSLVVMMAMPFAGLKGAHIRVDILDEVIGKAGCFLGDVFTRVVSCFVLFLLIRKTWDKTWDAHKYGDVTNMIELPVWIAYGAITAGMGLFALVLAVQLIEQLRGVISGHE